MQLAKTDSRGLDFKSFDRPLAIPTKIIMVILCHVAREYIFIYCVIIQRDVCV